MASRSEVFASDPDDVDRGTAAHARVQNALAAAVRDAGWEPRSSKDNEPTYDLAWDAEDAIYVAEVKSTTPTNEERQLRLGLGQVLRYRRLLDANEKPVRAVLAAEREPSDPMWLALAGDLGVLLVWPDIMAKAVGSGPGGFDEDG